MSCSRTKSNKWNIWGATFLSTMLNWTGIHRICRGTSEKTKESINFKGIIKKKVNKKILIWELCSSYVENNWNIYVQATSTFFVYNNLYSITIRYSYTYLRQEGMEEMKSNPHVYTT